MSSEEVYETSGFDAIADRLEALYPGQEEKHYGTIVPYALGGNDPLDGVSVYKSEKGMPHWHYVTFGFSELYEKESDDDDVSGYGFELTFRLKRGDEEEPPMWPISLMQNLARYVFSSGNVFGSGHHMSCNGPIALEEDTLLTALGFRIDPELGEMDTPNGRVEFLQTVGITQDEMYGMMCWDGAKFMNLLEKFVPMCVADMKRDSVMENPEFEVAWKKGVDEDGSSTGFLYLDEVSVGQVEAAFNGRAGVLQLGAGHAKTISTMLRARVGKKRSFYLQGKGFAIGFSYGEKPGFGMEEADFAAVILNDEALDELCAVLQPHAGETPLKNLPLILKLVPTVIKDNQGNVVEVIE